MNENKRTVTILIPCYNEEESLPMLFARLTTLSENAQLAPDDDDRIDYRFLFVDDGVEGFDPRRNPRVRQQPSSYVRCPRGHAQLCPRGRPWLHEFLQIHRTTQAILDAAELVQRTSIGGVGGVLVLVGGLR